MDPLKVSLIVVGVYAKALRLLISKAIDGGLLEGCDVRSNGLTVSLLQFANDSLFFLKAKEDQICVLRCILLFFEVAFGLKVHLNKSKMMGVGSICTIC